MTVQRFTESDFADMISQGIESRDVSADTRIGSIRDLFVKPPAAVFKTQNDNIVYLSLLTSLQNAEQFYPDDLNAFVFNEGLVRWSGASSVAVVTFARIQPPTANILIPVNFPLATVQDPSTGRIIQFRTIETQIMYGPLTVPASAYYNVETQRYEINVACASVTSGADTMVGAYTITQMKRPFPQFDYVYNKLATTSGRGLETNTELARRYLMQIEGSQSGTPTGLQRFVLDAFSASLDAYVVYGDNADMVREVDDAGAVDCWILGDSAATASYTTTYTGIEVLIVLDKQPLMEVFSVSDVGTTYVQGVDYVVVKGEGVYAYSDRGSDGIRFLATGVHPTLYAPITISYSYNALIPTITSYYKQNYHYVMGSDVLFRWSQAKYLEIEAQLKVKSGNPATVLSLVRDRVTNYINGLKLGADVEEFDIDAEVSKVFGVDNWVYVTLAVKGGTGVSDIVIGPYEYARILAADLVVNLV